VGREFYLDEEHRGKAFRDYPRLTLEENEKARVYLIDINPETKRPKFTVEFAHFIKGAWYILCPGDYKTVLEQGADAAQCPACAVATGEQDEPVGIARRRFACHVIRYHMDARGKLLTPLAGEVLAWIFGDDKFNKLLDLSNEYDLVRRDLMITCTGKKYQKFDIAPGDEKNCIILRPEEPVKVFRQRVIAAYREDKLEDLTPLLGRRAEKEILQRLVSKAMGIMAAPPIEEGVEPIPPEEAMAGLFDVAMEEGEQAPSAELPVAEESPVPTPAEESVGTEVQPGTAEPAVAGEPVDMDKAIEDILGPQ